ncbi:MAG: hypothetical protein LBN11_07870 [Tannerella sp.]|nr:hypothetical protein [Tannerella sp.]
MLRKYVILILVGVSLIACSGKKEKEQMLKSGQGIFEFTEYEPLKDKPVYLHYYIPEDGDRTQMPILIVFHGNGRKPDSYLNVWIPFAQEKKFIVVVPGFSQELYPEDAYNWGDMMLDGVLQPEEKWTFSIVEPIFDFVKSDLESVHDQYDIYGHSAGSQFAHRFLIFKNKNRVNRAVMANAGWYTVPDENIDFPYGLKNTPVKQSDLKDIFAKEAYVLLGTADTDPNHKDLKRTEGTNKQGAHRFGRGHYFMEQVKRIAGEEGFKLNWQVREVEGAGHSNGQMAPAAVSILYK